MCKGAVTGDASKNIVRLLRPRYTPFIHSGSEIVTALRDEAQYGIEVFSTWTHSILIAEHVDPMLLQHIFFRFARSVLVDTPPIRFNRSRFQLGVPMAQRALSHLCCSDFAPSTTGVPSARTGAGSTCRARIRLLPLQRAAWEFSPS